MQVLDIGGGLPGDDAPAPRIPTAVVSVPSGGPAAPPLTPVPTFQQQLCVPLRTALDRWFPSWCSVRVLALYSVCDN